MSILQFSILSPSGTLIGQAKFDGAWHDVNKLAIALLKQISSPTLPLFMFYISSRNLTTMTQQHNPVLKKNLIHQSHSSQSNFKSGKAKAHS